MNSAVNKQQVFTSTVTAVNSLDRREDIRWGNGQQLQDPLIRKHKTEQRPLFGTANHSVQIKPRRALLEAHT